MASIPQFHKIKKIGTGRQLTKIKGGYIWENGQFIRVWSGSSVVSYYDGDTLLGTEEVDDGEDALHPSISTTKSGYTLYGWATKKNPTITDRVTVLFADGDPKTLYAIYVPNTVLVVSNGIIVNNKYVSGGVDLAIESWGGQQTGTTAFTLAKGIYGSAQVTVIAQMASGDWGGLKIGDATFDGMLVGDDWMTQGERGVLQTPISNGSHSLFLRTYNYGDMGRVVNEIYVSNLTLSNPVAWT